MRQARARDVLASHRLRRRLVWIGAFTAAAGGVVAVALLTRNTPERRPDVLNDVPPTIIRSPKLVHLRPADRSRLLETSLLFVRTAVARRHLDQAYALVGPQLREGMSRAEWMKGNIPVVPFAAAGLAAWKVAFSYRNDIAFELSLVAKPGSSTVLGKTFTIELTRRDAGAPWLVSSWVPTGVSGVRNDPQLEAQLAAKPPSPEGLSRYWLFLPLTLLAMVVIIPATLGAHSWWVGRRAERQYAAERSS